VTLGERYDTQQKHGIGACFCVQLWVHSTLLEYAEFVVVGTGDEVLFMCIYYE